MTAELISIKSLWGMPEPLETQFQRIYDAGYKGIECPLPDSGKRSELKELLHQYGFVYVAQIFADDSKSFEDQVQKAAELNPLLINSQSGKDSMPFDRQLDFFRRAVEVEKGIGLPVAHETHRGRAMYSPWTTERLLNEIEDLKLTADFSHWVCVCESLLEEHAECLELAAGRTIHVHTRTGHAQGPQVPDPRDPVWRKEHDAHLKWWRSIFTRHQRAGTDLTFTPEYGPPGYMPTVPYTQDPVSDLWEICLWKKWVIENEWTKKDLLEEQEQKQ
ncbi:TIM barrel protein [Bacillus sp. FSL H8-0547]